MPVMTKLAGGTIPGQLSGWAVMSDWSYGFWLQALRGGRRSTQLARKLFGEAALSARPLSHSVSGTRCAPVMYFTCGAFTVHHLYAHSNHGLHF